MAEIMQSACARLWCMRIMTHPARISTVLMPFRVASTLGRSITLITPQPSNEEEGARSRASSLQVVTIVQIRKQTTEKKMAMRSSVLAEKASFAIIVWGSMVPPELIRVQSGQAEAFFPVKNSDSMIAEKSRDEFMSSVRPCKPFQMKIPEEDPRCPSKAFGPTPVHQDAACAVSPLSGQ